MTRPKKILLIVAASLAGLVLLLVVGAFIAVQTQWFRNLVHDRLVYEIENATGGRVEIGAFHFDWRSLRITVDNLVIHGSEPASAAPLFRAGRIQAELKIVSVLKRMVDISSVDVERPQAAVIVFPNGTTNLPEPKVKRQSDKDTLQTVVDLAIGRFNIANGLLVVADRKTPFNARGENLRAQLSFDTIQKLYRGQVSMNPLWVNRPPGEPLGVQLVIPVVIAADRIEFSGGKLETANSALSFSGSVRNISQPQASLTLGGTLSLEEFDRAFNLQLGPEARRAPMINAKLSVSYANDRLQISGLNLGAGASNLEASGVITNLKEPAGTLEFKSNLNLAELGRILRIGSKPAGTVQINGALNLRRLKDYSVNARLSARDVAITQGTQRLTGISGSSALQATPERIAFNDMRLNAFDGTFTGKAQIENMRRFRLDGTLNHFNLERLLVAAGAQHQPWNGLVSGPVHVEGGLKAPASDMVAHANLTVVPGTGPMPVSGNLNVRFNARGNQLDLDHSYVSLPHTRLELSGSLGRQVQINFTSTDLNDLMPVLRLTSATPVQKLPVELHNGQVTFTGTVSGSATKPQINGRITLANFVVEGRQFDRLVADVSASPSGASVQNASLSRGALSARFGGSIALANWKPQPGSAILGSAVLQNANLGDLAAIGGQPPEQFKGVLNATLSVAGTYGDPRGTLNFTAEKGVVFDQVFNRVEGHASYANQLLQLTSLKAVSGSAQVQASAGYRHAPGDFLNGSLEFKAASNHILLDRFPVADARWPGIAGALEFVADGSAVVRHLPSGTQVRLTNLNGKVVGRGIELDKQPFGDVSLSAATRGGVMAFQLASDFADAQIRGNGQWQLSGDYPVSATVDFSRVWLSSVREWLSNGTPAGETFDASAQGRVTVSGPAFQPGDLKGKLEVTSFEIGPVQPGATRKLKRVALHNDGPISLALDRSVVRISRARLVGPQTAFDAAGTISFQQKNPLDLKVTGNTELEIVHDFYRDIFAAGAVTLNASVRGPLNHPLITGRLDLKEASLNMPDVPNGISNANGTILFDGSQATVRNMTAETGGGKLRLAGFVGYGGAAIVFRAHATATEVRVRYPEGVSTTANADLTLTGTTDRSTLSGTVTIVRTGFNPRSDFGSILASTAEPVRTPAAKGGFLEGMRLDVQIQTAPNVQFQTALARDIQAEANLRLRGTAAVPALLGRINVTQGELTFFGTKYEIQQGSVAFYNPVKIEPVLNIDLETKTRGITVILNVSGPINRLNLTHRSDPPLQFSEIVALLATGRAPTSDPTLLARENTQPQSWQQMGASALLGEAIASPVSSRLQRFFGVSRLKIDPSFSGVENNPQARLTLEQQITRDITFTYITNLSRSNYQVVRVEWAFSREWSVIALREENGLLGLDFLYKKRFK